MAKATSKVSLGNGAQSMSVLTKATFACCFVRCFAFLRMMFETSMPTRSLTFSATWGNSKPVPQPASRMRFSFLRMRLAKAVFIFASCSS